jgi:hypothetical protein
VYCVEFSLETMLKESKLRIKHYSCLISPVLIILLEGGTSSVGEIREEASSHGITRGLSEIIEEDEDVGDVRVVWFK